MFKVFSNPETREEGCLTHNIRERPQALGEFLPHKGDLHAARR
jgi:hypothetical protein